MTLTLEREQEIRKRLKSPYAFLSREMQMELLREIDNLRSISTEAVMTEQHIADENSRLLQENSRLKIENARLREALDGIR